MPKQESIIHISGRLGDKVYYRRKDRKNRTQYWVRSAPETVKQTLATKRAAKNFGTASKCAKLIRDALHEYTRHCYDNTMHYRLNGHMFHTDNIQSLKDFRFNEAASIQQLLNVTPVIEKDDQGNLCVSIPGTFSNSNRALKNTTHLSIKAIALSVNFNRKTTRQITSEALIIKRGEKYAPVTLKLDANNTDNTLILLEVQSCYEVNGHLHPSGNRIAAALDILAVMPPQEQPKDKKTRYLNKAPRLWTIPYPAAVRTIRPVIYNSLPEG
jgi:hypothetical protein